MFPKDEIKRWRRVVHKELSRVGFSGDDPKRLPAVVMIAVSGFGTDRSVLCEITGQPESFVRAVLTRLRKQRVLSGQALRVSWDDPGFDGTVAVVLDALVAAGDVARPVDPKRSKGLKGKAGRKAGGINRPRTVIAPGAVFTPGRIKSNPLYELERGK